MGRGIEGACRVVVTAAMPNVANVPEGDRRLHGRETIVEALRARIETAAAGVPFVAYVEGEPGIGKSRLLAEVVAIAERRGLDVILTGAYELERERPFGPLIDGFALDVRAGTSTRSADADRAAARFEAMEWIVDLIQARGSARPVFLAVEDLHWADSATIMTLGRVARSAAHLSVSLVVTTRPTADGTDATAVVRALDAAGAMHVRLDSLDDAAVRAVAADLVDAEPGPNLLARLKGAAGNPLYVVEVVAALAEEALIETADGVADVVGADLPPNLRLTILRRLGFLPPQTFELLRLAAVLGSSFSMIELAAATGQAPSELLTTLRPALAAGLFAADADTLRFQHDLVRDAVYSDLPEAILRGIHLEVGRALGAAGIATGRVARHFERGTAGINAEASDWLWRAAEELEAVDAAGALSYAAPSLERTPVDHPDWDYRRALRAGFALDAGEPGAEEAALALIEEPLSAEILWSLEFRLVNRYVVWGRSADADRIAYARRRATAPQAMIAARVAAGRVAAGNLAGALDALEDLTARSIPSHPREPAFCGLWGAPIEPDVLTEMNLKGTHALLAWMEGRGSDAVESTVRAQQLMEQSGNGPQPGYAVSIFVLTNAGMNSAWASAARVVSQHASTHVYPEIDTALGFASWLGGSWPDAITHLETSRARALDCGVTWVEHLTCALAALVHFHQDRTADAEEWLASAEEVGAGFGFSFALWARALLADAMGRTADAFAMLGQAWDLEAALGIRNFQRYYAPDLVRLSLEHDDRARAATVADAVDSLAATDRTDGARAVAARCRGLIDADAELLLVAAKHYEQTGWPVERARALEEAAVALGSDGRDRARGLLEEALKEYERAGAARDETRAVRRLRDVGVQRRQPPVPARPTSGWGSLTDAERRVVELVAGGSTYREIGERLFISKRTVETHVSHVFDKVSVRSRAELTAAYLRDLS